MTAFIMNCKVENIAPLVIIGIVIIGTVFMVYTAYHQLKKK